MDFKGLFSQAKDSLQEKLIGGNVRAILTKYPDAKKLIDDGLKVNVSEYGRIAHQSNPRFDIGRFNDWVVRGLNE